MCLLVLYQQKFDADTFVVLNSGSNGKFNTIAIFLTSLQPKGELRTWRILGVISLYFQEPCSNRKVQALKQSGRHHSIRAPLKEHFSEA